MINGRIFCEDRLVTLGTVKARPLSMGGAFISMNDQLAAIDFNPAAFSLYAPVDAVKFSVYMNPLAPIVIFENRNHLNDCTVPFGWIVRGAGFSYGRIRAGFLIGEESLTNTKGLQRSALFDNNTYADHRNMSLAVTLALAPRVSLGILILLQGNVPTICLLT